MIELETPVEGETDEVELDRIPIFSIDGETYTMPGEVKPHIALKYLWMLKQDGQDYASSWLMEQALGADGFKALANYEPLTTPQFKRIVAIIQEHALGSMDADDVGKDRYSSNGSKKSTGHKSTKKT